MVRLALLGLTVVLVLTACGATTSAMPAVPTPTVYTAQDALDTWHHHGLRASLTSTGSPPPAGMKEAWLVPGTPINGMPFMLLLVAASPQAAQTYAATAGSGPYLGRRYVQANVIVLYQDDTVFPYLAALGDLH